MECDCICLCCLQFGICGPPQKRKILDEMTNSTSFGGYSCAATGQANSTSFKWMRSLLFTFAFQQFLWGPWLIAVWSVLAPRIVLFFVGNHHVKNSTAHVLQDLKHDRVEQKREELRVRLKGGLRGNTNVHVALAGVEGPPVLAGDLGAALDRLGPKSGPALPRETPLTPKAIDGLAMIKRSVSGRQNIV